MGSGIATVLVTGGRDYKDSTAVSETMTAALGALGPFRLIEGGASGADLLAKLWARGEGLEVITVPADWAADGRSAGPRRNARMLRQFPPDLVIAFPGGKGTADMVRRAEVAGLIIWRVPC